MIRSVRAYRGYESACLWVVDSRFGDEIRLDTDWPLDDLAGIFLDFIRRSNLGFLNRGVERSWCLPFP